MLSSHTSSCHVVIINWNGEEDTLECLESLVHYEPTIAITVIDNSDNHSPCLALAGHFPTVCFVYNNANVGFASACNQGFHLKNCAEVRYTLFLNNDTVITKSFIGEITTWMDANQKVAAVSPVINYYFDPDQPWFSGSVIDEKNMDIAHCNLTYPLVPTVVPWLTGCALIVRNEHFRHVGGFDESFFLYSEDVDLSLKLVNSGFKLVIYPVMSVLHKVAQSSNKVSPVSTYYALRNKILILRRYFPSELTLGLAYIAKSSIRHCVKSDYSIALKIKLMSTILMAGMRGLLMKKGNY